MRVTSNLYGNSRYRPHGNLPPASRVRKRKETSQIPRVEARHGALRFLIQVVIFDKFIQSGKALASDWQMKGLER